MEDAISSGMSVLLSAVAQPDDDDFSLDWSTPTEQNSDLHDSLGNSPSSIFSFDEDIQSPLASTTSEGTINDFELGSTSFSNYDFLTDPSMAFPVKDEKPSNVVRRPVMVRKRMRECSMVCWLFRTLLTSEYRALPLNAIFEIFEDTNPSSAHGRHWRQSIRHCLMTSAVFVRVLTPNPRKDFLVMNEAGSWWTVHPTVETACADDVFRPGLGHKCPPHANSGLLRMRHPYRADEEFLTQHGTRPTWHTERILSKQQKLAQERQRKSFGLRSSMTPIVKQAVPVNPTRGDHLVVDHEEEVIA